MPHIWLNLAASLDLTRFDFYSIFVRVVAVVVGEWWWWVAGGVLWVTGGGWWWVALNGA